MDNVLPRTSSILTNPPKSEMNGSNDAIEFRPPTDPVSSGTIKSNDVVRVFTSPIRIGLTVPLSAAARDAVRTQLLTPIDGVVGPTAHDVAGAATKIPPMVFRLKGAMTLQRRKEIKEEFTEHVRKAEERYLQEHFGEFVLKKGRWVAVEGEKAAATAVGKGTRVEKRSKKPKPKPAKVGGNKPANPAAESKALGSVPSNTKLSGNNHNRSVAEAGVKKTTKLNAAAQEFKPAGILYKKPTVVDEDAETPLVTDRFVARN